MSIEDKHSGPPESEPNVVETRLKNAYEDWDAKYSGLHSRPKLDALPLLREIHSAMNEAEQSGVKIKREREWLEAAVKKILRSTLHELDMWISFQTGWSPYHEYTSQDESEEPSIFSLTPELIAKRPEYFASLREELSHLQEMLDFAKEIGLDPANIPVHSPVYSGGVDINIDEIDPKGRQSYHTLPSIEFEAKLYLNRMEEMPTKQDIDAGTE